MALDPDVARGPSFPTTAFTVGQLAKLTGLTVRALHHYDAIGLLLDGAHDDVGKSGQPVIQELHGHALAGARVAGDHDEAAVGDAHLDAPDERVDVDSEPVRLELARIGLALVLSSPP
jgi:hypothetical protein